MITHGPVSHWLETSFHPPVSQAIASGVGFRLQERLFVLTNRNMQGIPRGRVLLAVRDRIQGERGP